LGEKKERERMAPFVEDGVSLSEGNGGCRCPSNRGKSGVKKKRDDKPQDGTRKGACFVGLLTKPGAGGVSRGKQSQ